jgi:succinate dehydrogenase / fumarate reductase, cytochrome b subunit
MADAAHLPANGPGAGRERPLSPHLQIYRRSIHMMMSIVHRLTGTALYFGTLLLAAWLMAAAMGPGPFGLLNDAAASPPGMLVLLGYTWALIHHMFGGIRHLIWDTGRGLDLASVRRISWLTIVGSLLLTGAISAFVLKLHGGL